MNLPPRDPADARRALREHDLLGAIDPGDLDALLLRAHSRRYDDGTLLFQKGDPGNSLFVIQKGGIKVYALSDSGREILLNVAEENQRILRHPTPQVHFMAFGDSSLDFRLLAWIQRSEQRQRITSEINFAIFAAFAEAKIEIPFPQRDLHIRSAEGLPGLPPPEEPPEAEEKAE